MPRPQQPALISTKKIWDFALHNALTDLILYKNRWFCVLRESDSHVNGVDGVIRVLSSADGEKWRSASLVQEKGIDLRDPKLSLTPHGKLMLLMGGTLYSPEKEYKTRQTRVSFSDDGVNWSGISVILEPHEWLWRLTWHKDKGYGASYRMTDPKDEEKEWRIALFETLNGLDYRKVCAWEIPDHPSEATLRFRADGTMIALVRRAEKAWIGTSEPPYTDWKWKETSHYLGGPNFVIAPDGSMWAAGRVWEETSEGRLQKVILAEMTESELFPVLDLPSGGDDTSYPGMCFHEGKLWITYYSSHEGKTAVYLARVLTG